ncbi:MAG: hypothetical protein AB1Z22_00940 [Synechococcaceae cyanobacterium]
MTSPQLARLGHFSINALRIGASTAAVVEMLRQHWIPAACFAVAWLLTIKAQRFVPEAPEGAEER